MYKYCLYGTRYNVSFLYNLHRTTYNNVRKTNKNYTRCYTVLYNIIQSKSKQIQKNFDYCNILVLWYYPICKTFLIHHYLQRHWQNKPFQFPLTILAPLKPTKPPLSLSSPHLNSRLQPLTAESSPLAITLLDILLTILTMDLRHLSTASTLSAIPPCSSVLWISDGGSSREVSGVRFWYQVSLGLGK